MSQINFGVGKVVLVPSGASPTPIPIAVLKDVSVDFGGSYKQLRGENSYAVAGAITDRSLGVKAKFAKINAAAYQAALPGSLVTTGVSIIVPDELSTIPATPFQVTVVGATGFEADLGVISLSTGAPMQRVASNPATGQYSVDTGTGKYTFASPDTGLKVAITYTRRDATNGKTVSVTNQLQGLASPMRVFLGNSTSGNVLGLQIYAALIPKIGTALKAGEFAEHDIEIDAIDDGTGRIYDLYLSK